MANVKVFDSMKWKVLERGAFLGVQFIIQLVMARILDTSVYGILSIMTIFISLAQVFVQTGLNAALVQTKEIDEERVNSVFWINLIISLLFYMLLYIFAPFIENYYGFDDFILPFRCLLVVVPLAAISSVQNALLSRKMQFKKIMLSSVISIVVSGGVGISLAIYGSGIWALVIQQLLYYIFNCILLCILEPWKIKLYVSCAKIIDLIKYGFNVLSSSLVENVYENVVSLVIGKRYTPVELAYYNRGKQYPNLLSGCIKEALEAVLLSAFSKYQDNVELIKNNMRRYVRISEMIVFFCMGTLAAMSKPLVSLMLTDKWLPCVPYLQIACVFFCVVPINIVTIQGINAIGRSDLSFKLCVKKRIISLVLVLFMVYLTDSLILVAGVWALTSVLNLFINANTVKKYLGYTLFEQIKDIFPYLFATIMVFCVQYYIIFLQMSNIITIGFQFITGAMLYIAIMVLTKSKGYLEIIKYLLSVKGEK